MNKIPQFGLAIKEARIKKNIPLWKFASRIPFPQSNIHKIENGQTEPRIGLAMRMLEVLELDAGEFLQRMAAPDSPFAEAKISTFSIRNIGHLPFAVSSIASAIIPSVITGGSVPTIATGESRSTIFGIFFRHVRLLNSQTQAEIAAFSAYSPRSLIAVENGHQEPAVGTALKLVLALNCDITWFFNELQKLYTSNAGR